jgi:hypothetical protein
MLFGGGWRFGLGLRSKLIPNGEYASGGVATLGQPFQEALPLSSVVERHDLRPPTLEIFC